MLVTQSRPRNLKWIHAGPLLYGDWGTSRLYVLGLAFLYTGHTSVLYLAAIGLLMLAVSWAYTIVCKEFPDGGGVYTAARQLSPTLSVVGATLLLSGYIMTAAISVIEAFHYFGVPHSLTWPLAMVTLVLVGGVNWLGAKSAGRFALVIAFVALGVSAVLAVLAIPFFTKGLSTISFDFITTQPKSTIWVSFTSICLALAGVEAVANMTGLMKTPVEKTAKRTIWPVAIEVVVLNMFFGIALAGLSYTVNETSLADTHGTHSQLIIDLETQITQAPTPEAAAALIENLEAVEHDVDEYTTAAMKVLANDAGERFFGARGGSTLGMVAGITFGLLLLSATNTAVMAMVSVLFAMAQDKELPKPLTKLNYSGVPWMGLVVAVVIPAAVITFEQDVTVLAKLYVLGVCGAITVTVGSCVLNKELAIKKWHRLALAALALFLLSISLTIAITEPVSTMFSGGLIALALASRFALTKARAAQPQPLDEPTEGWIAQVKSAGFTIDPDKPKIMLAARGRYQSEFAVDLAKRRNATLFAIFVRTLRVMDTIPGTVPQVQSDPDALEALGTTSVLAAEAGVPFVPIYVTSPNIAEEILDYTVTYGCDTLIMGKSGRSKLSRSLAGDVVTKVAAALPDITALITRSAKTKHKAKA
ncbi:MAG: amino acid transporter/nucleotide-binding universal stress UspA family protein [Phycisphaerales bacterium]|jgi:amino acid transporter/nucleotide-binding universal stress UspA family protein